MRFSSLIALPLLVAAACQRPATKTPDAPLQETRWMLRQLGTTQLRRYFPGHEPYLLVHTTGEVQGQGGCNSFGGKLVTTGDQLAFSMPRSTRIACDDMATESSFLQVLAATHYYRISGSWLYLYGTTDRTGPALAQLEAAPASQR